MPTTPILWKSCTELPVKPPWPLQVSNPLPTPRQLFFCWFTASLFSPRHNSSQQNSCGVDRAPQKSRAGRTRFCLELFPCLQHSKALLQSCSKVLPQVVKWEQQELLRQCQPWLWPAPAPAAAPAEGAAGSAFNPAQEIQITARQRYSRAQHCIHCQQHHHPCPGCSSDWGWLLIPQQSPPHKGFNPQAAPSVIHTMKWDRTLGLEAFDTWFYTAQQSGGEGWYQRPAHKSKSICKRNNCRRNLKIAKQ